MYCAAAQRSAGVQVRVRLVVLLLLAAAMEVQERCFYARGSTDHDSLVCFPGPVSIHAFLVHEIEQIRKQYNLPSGWPGKTNIWTLVRIAVPLFIFAVTVCRFISDPRCGGPLRKL